MRRAEGRGFAAVRLERVDAPVDRLAPAGLPEERPVVLLAGVLEQVGALDQVHRDEQPLGRRQHAAHRHQVRMRAIYSYTYEHDRYVVNCLSHSAINIES